MAPTNLLLERGLPRLNLRRVRKLLDSERLSCVELVNYCRSLAIAGESIWKLHAFCRIEDHDVLIEQAQQSDYRRHLSNGGGGAQSILDGIPVSVKANVAVRQWPLTAGSKILTASGNPRIGYNADVVDSMKGAILIGQTTMDEFGMGSLGHAETINPVPFLQHTHHSGGRTTPSYWDDDDTLLQAMKLPHDAILEAAHHSMQHRSDDTSYAPGGSSCGSAVSVSHGSSIISIGSDTGGSVRLPAAFCQVVGLKPSYGVISRRGLVAYASSLDTIGILAPSVDCAQLALQCLLCHTGGDSTQASAATIGEIADGMQRQALLPPAAESSLDGLRIGIPHTFSVSECPDAVLNAWDDGAAALQKLGASVKVDYSLNTIQHALSVYYVLVSAEASSNLMRYDGFRYGMDWSACHSDSENSVVGQNNNHESGGGGSHSDWSRLEQQYGATRSKGFGREVIRRILCGTAVLSSNRFHTHYEAAAQLRAKICQQMESALQEYDCLLVPTALSNIPPRKQDVVDPTVMLGNDVMTVPMSLAGLPTIAFPYGPPSPLFRPSLQLVAGRYQESKLLRVAQALTQGQE
jgi:aspartyl-tRNA(Asn)/glutamyl-tRNA(Gln) amidotransferase subunit A